MKQVSRFLSMIALRINKIVQGFTEQNYLLKTAKVRKIRKVHLLQIIYCIIYCFYSTYDNNCFFCVTFP